MCDVALCVDSNFSITTTKQIPENFQAVQLDLPTQIWGFKLKCKKSKLKFKTFINSFLFRQQNFNAFSAEISVLLFP